MADHKEDYRTNRADFLQDMQGNDLKKEDERDEHAARGTKASRLRQLRLARLAKDPMGSSDPRGRRRGREN
jgi:hypothetical protein